MSTPLLRRLAWLLVLPSGLLIGCHSAKPGFTFRPATSTPVATPAAPVSPAAPAVTSSAVGAPSAPAVPLHSAPRPPLRTAAAHPKPAAGPPAVLRQALRPRLVARHQVGHRPSRVRSESGRNTFHIVLGAVLIVSSIVVGLWLGGWLGLGVGAAIMLLGDYFLVLGIGGKHAWLEIFQEFFNM
ncbi:hypothetical protein EJV47_19725 [Hymenobacter gummosus]|uniref:Uncharacterized protein n=1 Tax=Hymenobacter gummosus TaxID=1776032 RepID=A0A3S0QFV9_9BACT|nr:hypothetical protein EJV47_19725 [Hymenobacter gummosus]